MGTYLEAFLTPDPVHLLDVDTCALIEPQCGPGAAGTRDRVNRLLILGINETNSTTKYSNTTHQIYRRILGRVPLRRSILAVSTRTPHSRGLEIAVHR